MMEKKLKGILPPGIREHLNPGALDLLQGQQLPRFPEQEHHLGMVTGTCQNYVSVSFFLIPLKSVATVEITAKGKWE